MPDTSRVAIMIAKTPLSLMSIVILGCFGCQARIAQSVEQSSKTRVETHTMCFLPSSFLPDAQQPSQSEDIRPWPHSSNWEISSWTNATTIHTQYVCAQTPFSWWIRHSILSGSQFSWLDFLTKALAVLIPLSAQSLKWVFCTSFQTSPAS